MTFRIPTLSETREFLIAMGKALFPDRNYGNPRSYHARRATFLSAAVTQVHAHVKSVQDDVMPDTAGDDGGIDRWGGIIGVGRKGASVSRKSAAGRVLGIATTAVDVDSELVHQASGLGFRISAAATVGSGGSVDVDIESLSTGAATRLAAGEVLEFVSTPAGLQTPIVLVKALDEDGLDSEQFGAYRNRVLARFSEPTAGGTQADYVDWGTAVEGVAQVYVYPNRAGLGTVDVLPLHAGSGADRELSVGDLDDFVDALLLKAPAPIAATGGSLRGLTAVSDPQDVEMVLVPSGEAAYAFDWIGGPLTVLTWNATTRALQFSADLPSSMKAGHRGCFKGVAVAGSQDGLEFRIESLSAADTVILEAAPAVDPAATDLFYSGGPLVTPIRSAILAHMNGELVYAGAGRVPLGESSISSTIGLEVIADGVGPANPSGLYGTWSGGLIRQVIGQIAGYKAGVRNLSIPTPASDYEATDYAFPNDATIGLIVPRMVLVRGAT